MTAEPGNQPPSPPRSPWQRLYTAAHALRRRRWHPRAHRLAAPVISVGSLQWGGAGKTPIVESIAAGLRDRGRTVAILSRGYGRSTKGALLVSRGDGLLGTVAEAGDEPAMLAAALPGVAIVVAEDRYGGGLMALAELDPAPDVFLLDDGFSHVRLHRDIDLLVFPTDDPYAGARLPPTGSLREPLASSAHATALIRTGDPSGSGPSAKEIAEGLRTFGFAGPAFEAPLRASLGPEPPTGPVLLVTGTARPQRVARTLRGLGVDIHEHLAFADHHPYPKKTLQKIDLAQKRHSITDTITTSKDLVKLTGRLEPEPRVLRIEAQLGEDFWGWLSQAGSISKRSSPPSTD